MKLLLLSMLLVSCGYNEVAEYRVTTADLISCTVKKIPTGAAIECPDGSVTIINHGSKGEDGTKGDEGIQGNVGQVGRDGTDGVSGRTCVKFKRIKRFVYKCVKYKKRRN